MRFVASSRSPWSNSSVGLGLRGTAPTSARPLALFPNDHAVWDALWIPRLDSGTIPPRGIIEHRCEGLRGVSLTIEYSG
jgi:hypothetical protein